MKNLNATIFDIKRYAIHDGPNIRTTVFFKGCPLRCAWCHNPEGIDFDIDVIRLEHLCVGCRDCIDGCNANALTDKEGVISHDKKKCQLCCTCVDICPALSLQTTGKSRSVQEIISEIEKDLPFFDKSGGGVTFSGGEPICQPEALYSLLKECGKRGVHRVVDTCGHVPTRQLLSISTETDLFFYDVKHMDTKKHQHFTGVGNELIHRNLLALFENKAPVRIRIPLVGGVNDSVENLVKTGRFISKFKNIEGIDILPYHSSAKSKYSKLGMEYHDEQLVKLTQEQTDAATHLLQKYISDVRIGG